MEKLTTTTEKAFLGDFIRLSPKINELSEILWFVFRMGGSVSNSIITPRFPDADGDLKNLVEMGILKEMEAGSDKVVAFSENFESRLIRKNLNDISATDIFDTLVEGYSRDLGKRYKLDKLIKNLSAVIAAVIEHASPEEPAFLNKVFRAVSEEISGDVTPESLNRSKELLEYYLFKYLGLVQPVGSFAVNLSTRGAQVVAKNSSLLDAYKAKASGKPAARKTEKPQEAESGTRPEEKSEEKPEEKSDEKSQG